MIRFVAQRPATCERPMHFAPHVFAPFLFWRCRFLLREFLLAYFCTIYAWRVSKFWVICGVEVTAVVMLFILSTRSIHRQPAPIIMSIYFGLRYFRLRALSHYFWFLSVSTPSSYVSQFSCVGFCRTCPDFVTWIVNSSHFLFPVGASRAVLVLVTFGMCCHITQYWKRVPRWGWEVIVVMSTVLLTSPTGPPRLVPKDGMLRGFALNKNHSCYLMLGNLWVWSFQTF